MRRTLIIVLAMFQAHSKTFADQSLGKVAAGWGRNAHTTAHVKKKAVQVGRQSTCSPPTLKISTNSKKLFGWRDQLPTSFAIFGHQKLTLAIFTTTTGIFKFKNPALATAMEIFKLKNLTIQRHFKIKKPSTNSNISYSNEAAKETIPDGHHLEK